MNKGKRLRGKKLNNKGSAIITVIVIVTFASILATTILYVSGMNLYMKMTDLKTKQSFYKAETAMEQIKASLEHEVNVASKFAYNEIMINYASYTGLQRTEEYKDLFFQTLIDNLDLGRNPTVQPLDVVLQTMVDAEYQSSIICPTMSLEEVDGDYVIRNVTMEYTDANGYKTIINTDFLITAPNVKFSIDESKEEWNAADAGDAAKQQERVKRDHFEITSCVQYYNWTKK